MSRVSRVSRAGQPADPCKGQATMQASARALMAQQDPVDDDADFPAAHGHFAHVRSTVAEAGVHKPAGVASSVFDAGRQAGQQARAERRARQAAPPLPDIDSVVIETGVPKDSHARKRATSIWYDKVLERMAPGTSVLLCTAHARGLVSAARKRGVQLSIRRLSDAETRVWRDDAAAGAHDRRRR